MSRFDQFKQSAFAAIAAILFSATMVAAAVAPSEIGVSQSAPADRA